MLSEEGLVREFIVEALKDSKVSASETYMKKEVIREKLQALVQEAVSSGEVQNAKELEEWWKTVEMAAKALKMVPLMAWQSSNKKV
jgi:predicted house-cleaning noncanonical NTP pyrophosphatase (MazG superfamily)